MRLTSSEAAATPGFVVKVWLYRASAYLLLNFVDDPVWLALIFC